MKKIILIILVTTLFIMVGCSNEGTEEFNNQEEEEVAKEKHEQEEEDITLKVDKNLLRLENSRNEVIDKFRTERGVVGTAKFIEDKYNKYKNDEIIATIYYYQNAVMCYEFYESIEDTEWLNKSKAYAVKISPEYNDVFSNEINLFVSR